MGPKHDAYGLFSCASPVVTPTGRISAIPMDFCNKAISAAVYQGGLDWHSVGPAVSCLFWSYCDEKSVDL